jgi:hypothetical protein
MAENPIPDSRDSRHRGPFYADINKLILFLSARDPRRLIYDGWIILETCIETIIPLKVVFLVNLGFPAPTHTCVNLLKGHKSQGWHIWLDWTIFGT